jgi:hypothetical protein
MVVATLCSWWKRRVFISSGNGFKSATFTPVNSRYWYSLTWLEILAKNLSIALKEYRIALLEVGHRLNPFQVLCLPISFFR